MEKITPRFTKKQLKLTNSINTLSTYKINIQNVLWCWKHGSVDICTSYSSLEIGVKSQYPPTKCKRPEVVACIYDPNTRWEVREKVPEAHRLAKLEYTGQQQKQKSLLQQGAR